MKIGIFGGTFDPPHFGHLILASEALEQLNLDKVLWLLTPSPPHKTQQTITDLKDRIRMVELAINGSPRFELSRVDIDRQPPHYAVDTVSILRGQNPVNKYFYLMGLDSLNDLTNWHQPREFVSKCDGIAVMIRSGESQGTSKVFENISGLKDKLSYLQTPRIDISASDIRSRVRNHRQFRYFVPEEVFRYINSRNLYTN